MTSTGEPGGPGDIWAAPGQSALPAAGTAPSAAQQPSAQQQAQQAYAHQQPYARQQYGPPPYAQPYPPAPVGRGTDGVAIAGFVLSIVALVLLSVPLCIIALFRIRKSQAGGRGFAIAGLVISTLWVLFGGLIAAAVFYIVPERDASGAIVEGGRVTLGQLRDGDCVAELGTGELGGWIEVSPCSKPHGGELGATFELPDTEFPGESAVKEDAEEGCLDRLPAAAGSAVDDEVVDLFYVYPPEAGWALGEREVLCFLVPPEGTASMTGSVLAGTSSETAG